MDYQSVVGVSVAISAASGAFLAQRILRNSAIPQVLVFLICGLVIRQFTRDPTTVAVLTRPITDLCLAGVGIQIGSHLNGDTLGPIKVPMAKFMMCFVPIVVVVVSLVAGVVFSGPLATYAPLVGSIAVERSSPEALAGINELRAAGSFTSGVLCIAAIQDVAALVCFVVFSSLLGSSNGMITLAGIFAATAIVVVCSYYGVQGMERLSKYASFVDNNKKGGTPFTVGLTVALIFGLTVSSYVWDSELLISAVIVGILLNYNNVHPITTVLDSVQLPLNLLLFTFLGLRINVISYVKEVGPIMILVIARFFALWVGSVAGGKAANFPNHLHLRWAGLVTQLAIALSLVTRMQEMFPQASRMAEAYGGVAIVSLLSGPALLRYALRTSGEVGQVNQQDDIV